MLRFFITQDQVKAASWGGIKKISRSYSREIYANVITEFPDFPAMEYGRTIYCYKPTKHAVARLLCKKIGYRKEFPIVGITYRRIKDGSHTLGYKWTFFFDTDEYEKEWVE